MKSKLDLILENNLGDIEKKAREGFTETEIYKSLGLSSATWVKYKKASKEIRDALDCGYARSLPKVEAALFKAACGYEYTETTEIRDAKGDIVETKTVKKYAQPNVSAILNILKCKLENEWNAVEKIDVKGKIEATTKTSILSDVCSEDVAKMAAELIKKKNKAGDGNDIT